LIVRRSLAARVSACSYRRIERGRGGHRPLDNDREWNACYWIEPGSRDCQLRPEPCDEPVGIVSLPPKCVVLSSVLLELVLVLLLDDTEGATLCGILSASPFEELASWLTA
jgi:hypothetical protein